MNKRGGLAGFLIVLAVAVTGVFVVLMMRPAVTGEIGVQGPWTEYGPDNKQQCFAQCFIFNDQCKQNALIQLHQCWEQGKGVDYCRKQVLDASTKCSETNRACRDYCESIAWEGTLS